ncbi:MAG: hypothetical protein QOK07_742 [Gemmatimonadaceae bacterium]|nr:hypothetical protein [Gemmatimonadaceae bacterium]
MRCGAGVVAIVDPYDAGVMLGPACRERGAEVIAVRGRAEMPVSRGEWLDAPVFSATVHHRGNVSETTERLRALGVGVVMAGSEWGVNLADHLSEALDIPSNGTRLSLARRNKFQMIEAVGAARLRVPAQFQSSDLGPMLRWLPQHWPAVLKPLNAASSDGVRLCRSEEEAGAAFQAIIGKTNVMALVNESVLAQEFISGDEYVVDTVSWEGRHSPAGFWRYGKPEPAYSTVGVFDTKELLPADGVLQRQLFEYVAGVLDALDIRYGPAHCEVKVDDEGPVLIEMGARLHGGPKAHQMSRAAAGSSQFDLMVQAYLDPLGFLAAVENPRAVQRTAVMLLLRPHGSGTPRAAAIKEVEKLPSFHELSCSAPIGHTPPPVAALLVLIHSDRVVVERDLSFVRHLHEDGLFD